MSDARKGMAGIWYISSMSSNINFYITLQFVELKRTSKKSIVLQCLQMVQVMMMHLPSFNEKQKLVKIESTFVAP